MKHSIFENILPNILDHLLLTFRYTSFCIISFSIKNTVIAFLFQFDDPDVDDDFIEDVVGICESDKSVMIPTFTSSFLMLLTFLI